MKRLSYYLLIFFSIHSLGQTLNSKTSSNQKVQDGSSITFDDSKKVLAEDTKNSPYINNEYSLSSDNNSENTFYFQYDSAGNQIKRFLNIKIFSLKKGNPAIFDEIKLIEDDPKIKQTVFQVYPNPTSNYLNIRWNSESRIEVIQLYDLVGIEVKNYKITKQNNKIEIDLSNIPSGIYILRFLTTEGNVISKKIIKK